jgi:hypothetical protein
VKIPFSVFRFQNLEISTLPQFLLFLFRFVRFVLFVVQTLRISKKDVFDESVIRGLLLLGSVTAGVPCLSISAHYRLLANWVKF